MQTDYITALVVNQLIETCNAREADYKKAADNIKDPYFADILNKFATESGRFFLELLPFSESRDEEEEEKEITILNVRYKGWMDVASGNTLVDKKGLFENCIDRERSAIEVYEAAFNEEIPEKLRVIIIKHKSAFFKACSDLNSLVKEL
ncbi:hypothetical protein MYP_1804 [Sporocytophaga myxococcoides]|uniref:DUF2383 domain-containing protein n=1 Tax=Sporocytophaga myxococcoides TaxID=153721 RepID=A0A098LC83_9BACT|nr:DUF2383 domain-containing protein [Sporocytophaga myxococcoides]GAL84576.1 hypothetical protein MYP_1804 [Sporocytophaga myxococcoides]